MISNFETSHNISAEKINKLLLNFSQNCLTYISENEFERHTLNNRVLAGLQSAVYKRNALLDETSPEEVLMLKRGMIQSWSSTHSTLNFFRWSRKSITAELATQASNAFNSNSLLVALISLRSILETIGNACLLKSDLEKYYEIPNGHQEQMEWLIGIDTLIDLRLAGMRVDYVNLIKNGLRRAAKINYKPGENESDLTAKDLLKGVDFLSKKVDGARNAYEFFSEFAHPNLASNWITYEQQILRLQVKDVHCYSVLHRRDHVGHVFLENFGPLLIEGIEIVEQAVSELLLIDKYLEEKAREVSKIASKCTREVIKKDPKSFDRRENCPCNSGKNIQYCCGKLIQQSKFGNWSTFKSLN